MHMKKKMKKIGLFITPLVFWGCPLHTAQPPQALTPSSKTQPQEETVKALQKLAQYEIDESFLWRQSIGNIHSPTLKVQLITYQTSCKNNIQELSALLKKYGGEAPEYSQDFKGYFMNGYAAMRGTFTDQGALKALHTNLKLIAKAFESALNSTLPSDVKDIVEKISSNKKKIIQDIEAHI